MRDYKIYPKQFLFDKVHIDKSRCFMIMPFSNEYRGVYADIKAELSDIGIMCNRVDEIKGSKPIMNKIITEILKSRYIIADLSECNANVFYELGIAHSFRDSRNILLLKRKESKYPFDLSHLPYVEYSPENMLQLREIVKKFINESRYAADFVDALFLHDISINTVDGRNNYIEYIQDYFESEIDNYTRILNGNSALYSYEDLNKAFTEYEYLLSEAFQDQSTEMMSGIIRVYAELLASCTDDEIIKKYVAKLFEQIPVWDNRFEEYHIVWKTDIMIGLAKKNKVLEVCMPWIIEYFSRSKASNIDLNRYKLEKFLVETDNERINDIIIESLYHNDCHVREHMADIIGSKSLVRGSDTLIKRLDIEENYYTIGSIVEAIGKTATPDKGMPAIETWISKKGNDIIVANQSFLLKHLYHAIARLDSDGNSHLTNFIKIFGPYLQENKVGPIV